MKYRLQELPTPPIRRRVVECFAVIALAFAALPSVAAVADSNAPPGNNGHIQIDEYTMDGGNGNDPHVSCGFSVSFFGYDGGTQQASITVTPWAPTSGGHAFTVATSWTTASRTSGNQFDQNVPISPTEVETAFAGVPPASQGYHAKIEVEVTGSQGSDDKYHTVWIAPCSGSSSGATVVAPSVPTTTSTSVAAAPPKASSPTVATPTLRTAASAVTPVPGLSIVKSERVGSSGSFVRDPVQASVGQQLQYRVVVTNTGNTALRVAMTDPRCDAGTLSPAGIQMIGAGDALTYTCSHVLLGVPEGGVFRNTAAATGTSPQGTTVGPFMSSVNAIVSRSAFDTRTLARAKPARAVLLSADFTG